MSFQCTCRQLFRTQEEEEENEEWSTTLHCCNCHIIFTSSFDLTYHRCKAELKKRAAAYARDEQELMNGIDRQLGIDQEVLDEMDSGQQVLDGADHYNIICQKRSCGEEFYRIVDYNIHLMHDHSTPKPKSPPPSLEFRCWRLNCERRFHTHDELDLHLRTDHFLHCWRLNCTRTFQTQEELNFHIQGDHDELHLVNEHLFSCTICNRAFPDEEYLNNHLYYDQH